MDINCAKIACVFIRAFNRQYKEFKIVNIIFPTRQASGNAPILTAYSEAVLQTLDLDVP